MKRYLSYIIFLSASLVSSAQSFDPYVIGTTGTFAASSSGSMAWTVGEVMTKTYSSGSNFFTQGFHQPLDTTFINVVADPANQHLTIFPNPVVDNLVIDFSRSNGNYLVELVSMQGQSLRKENVSADQKRLGISFQNFENGIYFLNVVNYKTQSRNSYKIIKSE